MPEFPEVSAMARQLTETVSGSAVADVRPPTKLHKFCWFGGAPAEYGDKLRGCKIAGAEGFGLFVELLFDNGLGLCFNDGVNVRLVGKRTRRRNINCFFCWRTGGRSRLRWRCTAGSFCTARNMTSRII